MIWASDGATLISPFLGNKVSATAPAEAATFTVTCTVGNLSLSKSFTTIEPAGVEDATIEKIYSMPIGVAGAGMKFYPIHIGPRTVSFYNVRCVEVGRDAVNATGYWVTNQPPSHIGNGADEWFSLDFENRWPQEWDKAMIIGIPSPWFEGGDFEWPIPAKWTVAGSGKEKEMMGWTQKFELSGDGSVTVRKFGKWVRRTIYDYCTWGED